MLIAKFLGNRVFRAAVRRNLLILCYHGFSADDEHEFKPSMFMRLETFARRMELLRRMGMPVLRLADALEALRSGTLEPGSVAITMDDGWKRTAEVAEQVLAPQGLPATVYVTTHYVERRFPVSNMMLAYLLWKGRHDLERLDLARLTRTRASSELANAGPAGLEQALRAASAERDAVGRDALNRAVAEALGIDYERLHRLEVLYLMDVNDLRRAEAAGCLLELHGHRHLGGRSADDAEIMREELAANRRVLSAATARPLRHYCYPSGHFHPRQSAWLRDAGIVSATTCEPGMNHSDTNPYALRRFLDREDIGEARFLSEITGWREQVRSLARAVGR